MNPEDAPIIPNVRVTAHEPPGELQPYGFSDRDNFIRNLNTIRTGTPAIVPRIGASVNPPACEGMEVPLAVSAKSLDPIIELDDIKLWLRIELDQTVEDRLLTILEMAARLFTEDYLRQTLDKGAGENIKLAMLLLIAHWYRNREAVSTGSTMQGDAMPLGYAALLSPQRDYPCIY